jgi:hypothetical protein
MVISNSPVQPFNTIYVRKILLEHLSMTIGKRLDALVSLTEGAPSS